MDSIPQKQCSKCPNSFPATPEYFHRDGNKLASQCKRCAKAYRELHKEKRNQYSREYGKQYRETHKDEFKRYRDEHKEEKLAYNQTYRMQNREILVAYQIQYNLEHAERKRAYSRQYGRDHREQRFTYRKRYFQSHREQRLAYHRFYAQTERGRLVRRAIKHRRRAIKKQVGGTYTPAQLQVQLKRQHHCCYFCQTTLEKSKWHADHIVPLTRDCTSNTIDNIVIACPTCNLKKHNKLPHEWPEGNRLL